MLFFSLNLFAFICCCCCCYYTSRFSLFVCLFVCFYLGVEGNYIKTFVLRQSFELSSLIRSGDFPAHVRALVFNYQVKNSTVSSVWESGNAFIESGRNFESLKKVKPNASLLVNLLP